MGRRASNVANQRPREYCIKVGRNFYLGVHIHLGIGESEVHLISQMLNIGAFALCAKGLVKLTPKNCNKGCAKQICNKVKTNFTE